MAQSAGDLIFWACLSVALQDSIWAVGNPNAGGLFPRVEFIVTNLRWNSKNVVSFYNKRGAAAKQEGMTEAYVEHGRCQC